MCRPMHYSCLKVVLSNHFSACTNSNIKLFWWLLERRILRRWLLRLRFGCPRASNWSRGRTPSLKWRNPTACQQGFTCGTHWITLFNYSAHLVMSYNGLISAQGRSWLSARSSYAALSKFIVSRSVSQLLNQSASQSVSQSISQLVNQAGSFKVALSKCIVSQSISQAVSQSISQSVS